MTRIVAEESFAAPRLALLAFPNHGLQPWLRSNAPSGLPASIDRRYNQGAQKLSLSASCIIRGSNALVIWPSVFPLFSDVPGLLNRAWLNTLNASTRRSIFVLSVIRNVFQSAASTFHADGPRMVALPALPKVPAG